jgi:hypothetical protein
MRSRIKVKEFVFPNRRTLAETSSATLAQAWQVKMSK